MWESILPRSIYKRSMCYILGSVFSRITKDMLLIDDMAAEETLQVRHIILGRFELIILDIYYM
jgi:centromere/kinetochore protein ZW10